MILKLKDGTEININSTEAKTIQDSLDDDDVKYIHLGNQSFDKKMFGMILQGGLTQPDWTTSEVIQISKRLEAKDRCRGQYSINKQINEIAHHEGGQTTDLNPEGVKWTALIQDRDWREMVRQQLRLATDQWCDNQAGECACEAEYLSNKQRHHVEWVTQS